MRKPAENLETSDIPGPSGSVVAEDSILVSLIDELTAAKRMGLEPDLSRAERLHPALAEDLRSLWATVWVAEEMARAVHRDEEDAGPHTSDAETVDWTPRPGSSMTSDSPDQCRPFGDYDLCEELGRGGMGVVSRAVLRSKGRVFALKRLLGGAESSPQDIERFQSEILAAGSLRHPNIVWIYQMGECEGQPYFTMQYIEGTTLARKLADGPLTALEAARLLVPVCRAIQYAQEGGTPPRPQAVEYPDRSLGDPPCQRLRPGQADRR